MVACSIIPPSISNIFKYKLFSSSSTSGSSSTQSKKDMWLLSGFHSNAPKDRPVEDKVHQHSLPETSADELAIALESLVNHTATNREDATQGVAMHPTHLFGSSWMHKVAPELEKLAARYHIGNFVVSNRATREKTFESMPIYARIGMHLLFYGKAEVELLGTEGVENQLRRLSVKQGKIYDDPKSAHSIASFVNTYELPLNDVLEPDITKYKTFNDFFFRKLKPDARPVQNLSDPAGICSAADCRLVVYPTLDLAHKFWVKGNHFNVPRLLGVELSSAQAAQFSGASLAIFRLAPQDYHRFHSPIDGIIEGEPTLIKGQYYTVNPQAVNEPAFDVLTANVRSVLYLTHKPTGKKVAFVAVGALLVGSIAWTFGGDGRTGDAKGIEVKRGEELGFFRYGGSTIVALFEKGMLEFDADLVKTSQETLETLVKVGESIGTSIKA